MTDTTAHHPTRREMLACAAATAAFSSYRSIGMASENAIPAPDYSIPGNGFHGRPENKREWTGDTRSFKVIFLSHCMLNQNARFVDVADFPAMFEELLEFLREKQVGIIQMPCPELYCLGLGRFDVRPGLEHPRGMARLERMIDDIVFTIREYRFQGFTVVGILGKEGSPACGVTETWLDDRHQPGEGVFIRELKKRLQAEKPDIPVRGVADFRQGEAVEWLKGRV